MPLTWFHWLPTIGHPPPLETSLLCILVPVPLRWKEVSSTPHHSLGAETEGGGGQSHGVETEGEGNDREPRDRGRPVLEEPTVLVATWIYALVMDTCRLYLRGSHSCISIQRCPGLTMQCKLR